MTIAGGGGGEVRRWQIIRVPCPSQNVNISFINNTARLSGAAIYASDMQQCGWLGNNYTTSTSLIFDPPEDLPTPFYYECVVLPTSIVVCLCGLYVLFLWKDVYHSICCSCTFIMLLIA